MANPGMAEKLFDAAHLGNAAEMRRLLDEGADLFKTDRYGQTPLHVAVGMGHEAVVKLLLDFSPLELENGQDVRIEGLVTRPDLNGETGKVTGFDESTSRFGVRFKSGQNLAVRRENLFTGADVAAKDSQGLTPLLYAASIGREAMVTRLIAAGADVATTNNAGKTALHLSAAKGYEPVSRALLRAGADVAAKDNDGMTPLHCAGALGTEFIAVLLEAGADVAATDSVGRTPLLWAAGGRHAGLTELLLDAGSDVAARDSRGMTSLHLAATRGCGAVVDVLLDAGADLGSTEREGYTALHLAAAGAQHGHIAVVQMLLDGGADVAATNDAGHTPLLCAVLTGCVAVAEILLEAGADEHARTTGGMSPVRLAASSADMADKTELFQRVARQREEVRLARGVAFAMGHHPRVGEGSLVLALDEGVVRMVLEIV